MLTDIELEKEKCQFESCQNKADTNWCNDNGSMGWIHSSTIPACYTCTNKLIIKAHIKKLRQIPGLIWQIIKCEWRNA